MVNDIITELIKEDKCSGDSGYHAFPDLNKADWQDQ